MKNLTLTSAMIVVLACLSGTANAAEVHAGNGIGFSNGNVNPTTGASPTGPWVANIIFDKNDLKANALTVVKTGDNLTHPRQAADAAKNGNSQVMPTLKSMSWCDDGAKSLMSSTPSSGCYGWSMHSRWIVLDLNALQKAGLTNVWVSMTAKRYNDNDAVATDDDLVPALTVFQGRQDVGIHLHWFPSQFQQMADFWAWKLTPFTGGTTQSNGWATGYMASGSLDSANVTGRVKLKAGGQNYLTLVVGGDAKHATAAEKHDVNFQLDVKLSKTKPKSSTDNSGGAKIDKCGCEIGKTQWHPSMNHCMAIDLCEPIAGTDDQCKTPAMCDRDGGR
ncbi:hypothetical protein [Methylomagnum sp.]